MLANLTAGTRRPGLTTLRIPGPAVMSGITVTLMYLFGPVPLYLATARAFGSPAQVTSGFFVAFLTAGAVTIALSVRYRQPLGIGWSARVSCTWPRWRLNTASDTWPGLPFSPAWP